MTCDADCVAIEKAGCCPNGFIVAVNKDEVKAYETKYACTTPPAICPMFVVKDTRVAQCDFQAHTCQMIDPTQIHCAGFINPSHACPDGFSCELPRPGAGRRRQLRRLGSVTSTIDSGQGEDDHVPEALHAVGGERAAGVPTDGEGAGPRHLHEGGRERTRSRRCAYGATSKVVKTRGDYGWFRFDGHAGDEIAIDVKSPNGDAVVFVLDVNDDVVAVNDDADALTQRLAPRDVAAGGRAPTTSRSASTRSRRRASRWRCRASRRRWPPPTSTLASMRRCQPIFVFAQSSNRRTTPERSPSP